MQTTGIRTRCSAALRRWAPALALAAFGFPPARAATVADVLRLLETQGLLSEGRAAVKPLLQAIDPEARLLDAREAAALSAPGGVRAAEEWPEGLCYLKLAELHDGAGLSVATQLTAWAEAGRNGIILDARGAGGGSAAAAERVAGLFASSNAALWRLQSARGELGPPRALAAAERPWQGPPLMVLIDRRTRDAAALLARALKGRPGVMLLGAPTRAAPRARELLPLPDGERLYVATGRLVGLEDAAPLGPTAPDLAVDPQAADKPAAPAVEPNGKPPSEKARADRRLMARVAGDAALARATDILLGLAAVRARDSRPAPPPAEPAAPPTPDPPSAP